MDILRATISDHSKSGYREAALVLSMITTVAHFVALLTYFWAVPATRDYDPNLEGMGLWKYCRWEKDLQVDRHVCSDHAHVPGWLRATQVCFTIGLVLVLVSLVNIIMSDCMKKLQNDSVGMMSFVAFSMMAAIMTAAAVIEFGMNIQDHPIEEFNGTTVSMKISWSYGLSCSAVVLQMICMVLAVLDLRLRPRSMDVRILRFSLSFPRSGSDAYSDQTPIQNGFDNINFGDVEVSPVSESSH